jgi:aromatic ring-cleaving dioxygenase
MLESHCLRWVLRELVQRGLHGQLGLHDQGGAQRQRVMQRKLHLSHHLHRVLLGELHQRHVRPHVRRGYRGTRDSERRRLPVVLDSLT